MKEKINVADIYNEHCPSRIVLDIISNKWVILIIEKLAQKNHRFGELKRAIGGISAKVLSHLLKSLELNGLIIRSDNSALILNVEYALSPLGKSLSHICHVITVWAEQHVHEIVLAKEGYQ
jgi:DNA-binding HxlR family transcriptional regulator